MIQNPNPANDGAEYGVQSCQANRLSMVNVETQRSQALMQDHPTGTTIYNIAIHTTEVSPAHRSAIGQGDLFESFRRMQPAALRTATETYV